MKMPTSDSEEKKVHEVPYASVAHLLRLDWNRILKYFEKVVGYYNSGFKRLFYPSIKTFDERTCKFEASAVFPFPWGGRPQTPALKTCLISLTCLGAQTCMYEILTILTLQSSTSSHLKRILSFPFSISGPVYYIAVSARAWNNQSKVSS